MSDKAILKFKTRQSRSKGANNALLNEGYLLGNIVEKGNQSISIAIKKDVFRSSLNANGRNAISWEKKFEYDVQYVDNVSFMGDWKIMFQTIGKVLKRDGITSATSVTMEEFMGS